MAKKAGLFAAVAAPITVEPPPPAVVPEAKPAPKINTTRVGKHIAAAFLSKEAHKQLKQIALDEDCEVQALVAEGINEVFSKRGLGRIA